MGNAAADTAALLKGNTISMKLKPNQSVALRISFDIITGK